MAESNEYEGVNNRRRRATDRRANSDAYSAPTQGLARMATLAALLIITIYTAFAVFQAVSQPQMTTAANQVLAPRTETISAHLDAEASDLRGGVLAARALIRGEVQQPSDAIKTGLAATGGAALAMAVVGEQGVIATAGKAGGVDWLKLDRLAEMSAKDVWLGSSQTKEASLATATATHTIKGVRRIIAVGDPARVTAWLSKDRIEVIATPEGAVIAASTGAAPGDQLGAALGIAPTELNLEGGLKRGKLSDGHSLDVAARPALGGALFIVAAAGSGSNEFSSLQLQLARLLAVWGASMLLGLLLITQSRKAEAGGNALVLAVDGNRDGAIAMGHDAKLLGCPHLGT